MSVEITGLSADLVLEMEMTGDSSIDLFPLLELSLLQFHLSPLQPGHGADLNDGTVIHQDPLSDVDTESFVCHVDYDDVNDDEDDDKEKHMEEL